MEVKINVDVYAYYEHQCPIYRIWIDDTLYNEREFWTDCLSNYIEEEIYVNLDAGEHVLTVERITAPAAKIWVEKVVISYEGKHEVLSFQVNPEDKQTIKFLINIA